MRSSVPVAPVSDPRPADTRGPGSARTGTQGRFGRRVAGAQLEVGCPIDPCSLEGRLERVRMTPWPGRAASVTTALRGGSNSVTVIVSRVSRTRGSSLGPGGPTPSAAGGRDPSERQRPGTHTRRVEEIGQKRPDLVGRAVDRDALVSPHRRLADGGVRGARFEERLLLAVGPRLVTFQEPAEQRPEQDPHNRRFQVEPADPAGALRRCQ